jgi:hypothetical protein
MGLGLGLDRLVQNSRIEPEGNMQLATLVNCAFREKNPRTAQRLSIGSSPWERHEKRTSTKPQRVKVVPRSASAAREACHARTRMFRWLHPAESNDLLASKQSERAVFLLALRSKQATGHMTCPTFD